MHHVASRILALSVLLTVSSVAIADKGLRDLDVTVHVPVLTVNTADQRGSAIRLSRAVLYGYDWRDRRISMDGEVDRYESYTYDNLDRLVQVDLRNTTSGGTLIGRSESNYDSRGRIWRSVRYGVDPTSGSIGNQMVTHNWYDENGNVIKSIRAGNGAIFTKRKYDTLDRVVREYVGYDTAETLYADAQSVTGDTILSQVEYTYDDNDCVIQVTSRERLHTATGTGELTTSSGSQPQARVSYAASWCDGIGRTIATANYGTNNNSSFTRPSAPPTRSDDVLVTSTEYDDAGEVFKTLDPKAIETRQYYDHAGRTMRVVEAYEDGVHNTGNSDRDRTTVYTYTPDGRIATQTAKNHSSPDQVTTYIYGTTTAESGVASNRLLRAVVYPDSDDTTTNPPGNGSDGVYDRVEYKYNRLCEITERKDQTQTVHAYDYDKLGRLLHDRVTSFGSNVDNATKRISRTYEVRGMISSIASYDNATAGSGNVLNEVKLAYNEFGQLLRDEQDHDSVVGANSLKAQYTYSGGAGNRNRLTKLTYPNGREVHHLYSDAGGGAGVSDALSRLSAIATADTRGTNDANVMAAYEFNGLASMVRKNYPQPKLMLDYYGGTSGTYAGLDRFDRVTTHRWVNYNGTTTDVFRLEQAYDRNSNRLYAEDKVYTGSAADVCALGPQ